MIYSLSNYKVSITPKDAVLKEQLGEIVIGGEGSYLGSITVSYSAGRSGGLWSTTGYATGAYVQNKSLDRTGSVDLSIVQLSAYATWLRALCNAYYSGEYEGCTISVKGLEGEIYSCDDCLPTGIPNTSLDSSSKEQTWSFTCGKIEAK